MMIERKISGKSRLKLKCRKKSKCRERKKEKYPALMFTSIINPLQPQEQELPEPKQQSSSVMVSL